MDEPTQKSVIIIVVSASRAQSITGQALRASFRPNRNPGQPPCDYYDTDGVRKNADYWLAQIEKTASAWGVHY